MQNLSEIGQETKKLQKMGNDIISKNSSAIFMSEYFLLIPIDVPSFKLIEGQKEELPGPLSAFTTDGIPYIANILSNFGITTEAFVDLIISTSGYLEYLSITTRMYSPDGSEP